MFLLIFQIHTKFNIVTIYKIKMIQLKITFYHNHNTFLHTPIKTNPYNNRKHIDDFHSLRPRILIIAR